MAESQSPVSPPAGARSGNDLHMIELPEDVERAGRRSHSFVNVGFGPDDWDERCMNCDCRPYGQWSRFACSGAKGAVSFEDFTAASS